MNQNIMLRFYIYITVLFLVGCRQTKKFKDPIDHVDSLALAISLEVKEIELLLTQYNDSLLKVIESGRRTSFLKDTKKNKEALIHIPAKDFHLTDSLFSDKKKVLEQLLYSHRLIEQSFFCENSSYYIQYPGRLETNIIYTETDLTTFPFFYPADIKFNPDKKLVWTRESYLSPFTGSWGISCLFPVYKEGTMLGVLGINTSVGTLKKEFLLEKEKVLICNEAGILVAGGNKILKSLFIPLVNEGAREIRVFQEMKRDRHHNLLLHKNKNIREAFEEVLIDRKEVVEINDPRKFYLISRKIPPLDWFVIQLID